MRKLLLTPPMSRPMPYDPRVAAQDGPDSPLAAALERVGDRWSLLVIEALLADWGGRASSDAEPMRHATCGTPVEARLWCPTCARTLEEPEADGLRFV